MFADIRNMTKDERLEDLKRAYIARLDHFVYLLEDELFDKISIDLLVEEVFVLQIYNRILKKIMEENDENNS